MRVDVSERKMGSEEPARLHHNLGRSCCRRKARVHGIRPILGPALSAERWLQQRRRSPQPRVDRNQAVPAAQGDAKCLATRLQQDFKMLQETCRQHLAVRATEFASAHPQGRHVSPTLIRYSGAPILHPHTFRLLLLVIANRD